MRSHAAEPIARIRGFALRRAERERLVGLVLRFPRGSRKEAIEAAARRYGVTGRTAYRYAALPQPCPGPRCMTMVRGGGLCGFCRRSWGL